jgi:predicted Rossmann fold nucleotide-binding protein DprA/Smf involved in DNA uptake
MELALRDYKIYQMNQELQNRKKLLCQKRKYLKQNAKENLFLKDVFDDYNDISRRMVEQKERQIEQLNILNTYISSISKELTLTDEKMNQSKIDQEDILKEINKLREDIIEMTETN